MHTPSLPNLLLAGTTAHLALREGAHAHHIAMAGVVPGALLSGVLCTLNLVVTGLLIVRSRTASPVELRGVISTLAPVVFSGALLGLSRESITIFPAAMFVLGGVVSTFSLLTLGRSFAFVPAKRLLKTRGVYRVVRHPAYAGELLMSTSLVLGVPSRMNIALYLCALVATIGRIHEEERVLSSDAYAEYKTRVRFALIPGFW